MVHKWYCVLKEWIQSFPGGLQIIFIPFTLLSLYVHPLKKMHLILAILREVPNLRLGSELNKGKVGVNQFLIF